MPKAGNHRPWGFGWKSPEVGFTLLNHFQDNKGMPGTMQRQGCPCRGRPCLTPCKTEPHCGAGCTSLLDSQSLMWEAPDSANQPPGAKSDYVICSLSIWPALTSSLLGTHFSPLKWFTNQIPENVVSMSIPLRLCMLTNQGSGTQRLGQPLH